MVDAAKNSKQNRAYSHRERSYHHCRASAPGIDLQEEYYLCTSINVSISTLTKKNAGMVPATTTQSTIAFANQTWSV